MTRAGELSIVASAVDTSSENGPLAYERELRQLRRAKTTKNPKRADLVEAALQDMIMVKRFALKYKTNSH
jgi:hypothetical protein|tara:strand:- start:221 stop:430 length:210 start_codon:yes stop_codon:yes gene_type:complete